MNMADPWSVLINSLQDTPENHPLVRNRDMQALQKKATAASMARRQEQREEKKTKVVRYLTKHGDIQVNDLLPLLGNGLDHVTKLLNEMERDQTIRRYYKVPDGECRARRFITAL